MGLLRKELIETLGLARARRLLTRFGYACGYRDALTSKELGDWTSLTEWWTAGPRLHTLEGVVTVRVLRARMDQATGRFDVEALWHNSYEAEQHRTHIGPSEVPVCWTLTGYASGRSTAVFGREVFCYEPECVGKGDARCRVIAQAADAADPAVYARQDDYRVENVEAELGRVLEALEQQAKALAQQRARVSVLEAQLSSLREVLHDAHGAAELVGTSTAFHQALRLVERVAPTDTTVLLCGETGTGAWSRANSSGMRKAPSRAQCSTGLAGLRPRTAAPCSWMKLAICRWRRRRNCCVCWSTGSSSGWAVRTRAP
jgi:hypothetical protein